MSKKANPTLVGAFVLGALGLLVFGILVLSKGALFNDSFTCVAFFDESIDGLDVGAPVDFQGVRIGTVTDVRLVMDRAVSKKMIRPVMIRLESGRLTYMGDSNVFETMEEGLEYLVGEGLRAQLAPQSMLTGKLKIELGLHTNTPVQRLDTAIIGFWQMPTIQSPLQKMTAEVRELPLKDIVYEVHTAVKGISEIVSSEATRGAVSNAAGALVEIEQLAAKINSQIDPLMTQSAAALASMNQTMTRLQTLMETIEPQVKPFIMSATQLSDRIGDLIEKQSPLRYQTQCALEEVTAAARSLRYLTDYLERHPEALLRGKTE